MGKRDYYDILNINRDADPAEIKKAYRNIALRFHPDRNAGADVEDKFQQAAEAYEVLQDPEKRKTYDLFGHEGLQGAGYKGFSGFEDIFGGFSDLFDEFFGGGSRKKSGASRGRDIRYELEIDFKEAACGKTAEIEFQRKQPCSDCNGLGSESGELEPCLTCQGRGQVFQTRGLIRLSAPCPDCMGQGGFPKDPCAGCGGQGSVIGSKSISIRIPAGVDTGSKLRLKGEGEIGLNGAQPGDLYIVIYLIPHPVFEREGNDVYQSAEIPMITAALGGEIQIETLHGRRELFIPKGTQGGEVFRFDGDGFPSLKGAPCGDHIIEMQVATPTNLTPAQESLLRDYWNHELEKKTKP